MYLVTNTRINFVSMELWAPPFTKCFTRNRLQASANEIALVGARKLNANDRIGQMNNMVAVHEAFDAMDSKLASIKNTYPMNQIPSSCRVKLRLKESSNLGVTAGGTLESTDVAGATGASPQQ